MEKTESAAIGGMAFIIEVNAYEKLNQYLTEIGDNFPPIEKEEIIQDIEYRIAELLKDKLVNHKEVINTSDVNYVIGVMGQPADYESNENETHNKTYSEKESTKKKQLFRDAENKTIAGVCAGIANYFGWDLIIVKAIFIISLFFGGLGIITYIVLWALLPKAKTISDKLKMRGLPVTISSIEKSFKNFGKDLKNIDTKPIKKMQIIYLKISSSFLVKKTPNYQ